MEAKPTHVERRRLLSTDNREQQCLTQTYTFLVTGLSTAQEEWLQVITPADEDDTGSPDATSWKLIAKRVQSGSGRRIPHASSVMLRSLQY
jgi:hypothetical protein